MTMQLSIREASRFVIGAATLRATAMASEGVTIDFDDVAYAAQQPGGDGVTLRQSIDVLADNESAHLRNTPPHRLKTPAVLQTRQAEMYALTRLGDAVIATIEHGPAAIENGAAAIAARERLIPIYVEAFKAIDATPGSTQDKRAMQQSLSDQVRALTTQPDYLASILGEAATKALEQEYDAIFSSYENTDRLDDDGPSIS